MLVLFFCTLLFVLSLMFLKFTQDPHGYCSFFSLLFNIPFYDFSIIYILFYQWIYDWFPGCCYLYTFLKRTTLFLKTVCISWPSYANISDTVKFLGYTHANDHLYQKEPFFFFYQNNCNSLHFQQQQRRVLTKLRFIRDWNCVNLVDIKPYLIALLACIP